LKLTVIFKFTYKILLISEVFVKEKLKLSKNGHYFLCGMCKKYLLFKNRKQPLFFRFMYNFSAQVSLLFNKIAMFSTKKHSKNAIFSITDIDTKTKIYSHKILTTFTQ